MTTEMNAFNTMAEEKCGFYITEIRKKLWEAELDALREFDRICRKYNIRYFLIGGAAIGVERHKGFIPWDDDIDIGMLRDDFEKFLAISRTELKNPFHLQYGVDDCDDWSLFCRIRHNATTAIIKWQRNQKCNHGVYIELYPFDKVPNSAFLQYIQIEVSSLFRQLIEERFLHNRNAFFNILALPFRPFSVEWLFKHWNKVCSFYNSKDVKMVNTISMPNYAKQRSCYYEYEDVCKTVYKPFETIEVQMAVNNDKILRICYGDYMLLPPVKERGAAHNRIVYFDPSTPWELSIKTDLPKRFFDGEWDLGRL